MWGVWVKMTIFVITESKDDWHNFSTHIGDNQKVYAEYMICAASPITPNHQSISIKVEIIFDRVISQEDKDIYRKAGILLDDEK